MNYEELESIIEDYVKGESYDTILECLIDEFGEDNVDGKCISEIILQNNGISTNLYASTTTNTVCYIKDKLQEETTFVSEYLNDNPDFKAANYSLYSLYENIYIDNSINDENVEKFFLSALKITLLKNKITDNVKTCFIIRFPKITITNESNESTSIYDLFCNMQFWGNSFYDVTFFKTTFSKNHLFNGYIHSHIPTVGHSNTLKTIAGQHRFCFGSSPILNTMNNLRRIYLCEVDKFREWFGMFCFELNKTLRVESLAGTPYITLSSASSITPYRAVSYEKIYREISPGFLTTRKHEKIMNDVILEYAKQGMFKFSYVNGVFDIGESYDEFVIKFSKFMISYINKKYDDDSILLDLKTYYFCEYIIKNNKIYPLSDYDSIYSFDSSVKRLNGKFVFKFKGNDVNFKVLDYVDLSAGDRSKVYLLVPKAMTYVYGLIIKIINTLYGKTYIQQHRGLKIFV